MDSSAIKHMGNLTNDHKLMILKTSYNMWLFEKWMIKFNIDFVIKYKSIDDPYFILLLPNNKPLSVIYSEKSNQ